MKICVGGTGLFNTDRRADMTKAIVAFCSFANAPKIIIEIIHAMS